MVDPKEIRVGDVIRWVNEDYEDVICEVSKIEGIKIFYSDGEFDRRDESDSDSPYWQKAVFVSRGNRGVDPTTLKPGDKISHPNWPALEVSKVQPRAIWFTDGERSTISDDKLDIDWWAACRLLSSAPVAPVAVPDDEKKCPYAVGDVISIDGEAGEPIVRIDGPWTNGQFRIDTRSNWHVWPGGEEWIKLIRKAGESPSEGIPGVGPNQEMTVNESGGKQSAIPYRCDLLPARASLGVAHILHEGAEKYGDDNWRKIGVNDHLNHAITHLFARLSGDRQDDHLGHAATRLLMALELELTAK